VFFESHSLKQKDDHGTRYEGTWCWCEESGGWFVTFCFGQTGGMKATDQRQKVENQADRAEADHAV
jgi:hypothetical protein